MNWDELDWAALDRLRSLFLAGGGTQGPYWRSRGELASYDFTYGERIGWKWDAVLRELGQRGWKPPGPPAHPGRPGHAAGAATGYAVLDWGCGSGVAGRRVVRGLGADHVAALRLWDHSAMAADYAAEAASLAFPGMRVENVTPGFLAADGPVGLLVISHVLNELPAAELLALRGLAARADAILWVEPGTTEVSRALIEVREQLRVRLTRRLAASSPRSTPAIGATISRHRRRRSLPIPTGSSSGSGPASTCAACPTASWPWSAGCPARTPRRIPASRASSVRRASTRALPGF